LRGAIAQFSITAGSNQGVQTLDGFADSHALQMQQFTGRERDGGTGISHAGMVPAVRLRQSF
jgi:hypothetical protein